MVVLSLYLLVSTGNKINALLKQRIELSTNGIHNQKHGSKWRLKRSTYSSVNISDDTCLELSSCAVAKSKVMWYCHCDDDCIYFDDCCYDNNQSKVNEYTETSERRYTCNKLGSPYSANVLGFFSIDSCPPSYTNKTIIWRCIKGDNFETNFFVLHNKSLVYKNKYCALCNNVIEYEYFFREVSNLRFGRFKKFLTFTKEKRREKLETMLLNTDNIPPPDARLRFCLTNVYTTNNSLCRSYISPVLVKDTNNFGRIYKNANCIPTTADIKSIECLQESMFEYWSRNPDFLTRIMFSVHPEKLEQGCDVWTEEVSIK